MSELGLRVAADGLEMHGRAEVVSQMCVPGSSTLRTSVFATWADVLSGAVAGQALNPRIPLTLDLEVQLHDGARQGDQIAAVATAVKIGRTVLVCETRFRNERTGALAALAYVSFIASPDPRHVFPDGFPSLAHISGQLTEPLAERIGSRTVAPGTVEVPRRPDGLNASGAIQGGIVAFAAEEAGISLVGRSVVAEALTVRYLRPIMIGPGRATAEVHGSLAVVRIADAGAGKLTTLATARLVDAD
ncbi:hotdog domain-containing protein [Parafrankia sp. FMc6]|uniref:PaaI family thioesterase n=1 Tax=Parafrankia soli TaxID=2599596 RepID=UPI0034D623C8